jgi:thiamine pyrophosphokinase
MRAQKSERLEGYNYDLQPWYNNKVSGCVASNRFNIFILATQRRGYMSDNLDR